jgi:hypothetical protein
MERLINRQHVVAPICSKCGYLMTARTRQSTFTESRARAGAPRAPRLRIAVWRCEDCGIDRPRLE